MSNLRRCLHDIRDPATTPSTILVNGKTAEETAHAYLLQGNRKRNHQKRERERVRYHKKKQSQPEVIQTQHDHRSIYCNRSVDEKRGNVVVETQHD